MARPGAHGEAHTPVPCVGCALRGTPRGKEAGPAPGRQPERSDRHIAPHGARGGAAGPRSRPPPDPQRRPRPLARPLRSPPAAHWWIRLSIMERGGAAPRGVRRAGIGGARGPLWR